MRELSRMMAFAERYQAPGSVVYFDVDGLKEINDSLGHGAGDAVLGHLAEVLVRKVRASDIVGRLGGDEFGVILSHTGREAAQDKARSLAEAIGEEPANWNGSTLEVRVSFGIHTFAGDEPIDEALHAADQPIMKIDMPKNNSLLANQSLSIFINSTNRNAAPVPPIRRPAISVP